jgi:hypothetical protein
MEASAQPAAPDSHDARESRTGGPMRGTTRAGGGAESAGIDLAWARHQQVMRDKKVRGAIELKHFSISA